MQELSRHSCADALPPKGRRANDRAHGTMRTISLGCQPSTPWPGGKRSLRLRYQAGVAEAADPLPAGLVFSFCRCFSASMCAFCMIAYDA